MPPLLLYVVHADDMRQDHLLLRCSMPLMGGLGEIISPGQPQLAE